MAVSGQGRPETTHGGGRSGISRILGRQSGFTLVEMIVAIVIFMIVVAAVYGTFRAANMSASLTEERIDLYQTGRIILDQIGSELRCAYQSESAKTSTLVGENDDYSGGIRQYDTLMFITTAHRPAADQGAQGRLCKVTYTVPSTPDGKPLGLWMEEDLHPGLDASESEEQKPTPIKLSGLVVSFNCAYLGSDTSEWADEWTNQTKMPRAVRVELLLKPTRKDTAPIMVSTTVNLAMSSGSESAPGGGG